MKKLPMGALIVGSDVPWTFGMGSVDSEYADSSRQYAKLHLARDTTAHYRIVQWKMRGVLKLWYVVWYVAR